MKEIIEKIKFYTEALDELANIDKSGFDEKLEEYLQLELKKVEKQLQDSIRFVRGLYMDESLRRKKV